MAANVIDELNIKTTRANVRVFISYSRADQSVVLPFAERLRERDFTVFLDTHNIPGGANWQHEIETALEASDCCMACVGASGIGKWHDDEIQLARVIEKRKPGFVLVPVLLPGACDDTVRGFLEIYNIIDLRNGDDDAAFEALVEALKGKCVPFQVHSPLTFTPPTIVPKRSALGCSMRIVLSIALMALIVGISIKGRQQTLPAAIATPVEANPTIITSPEVTTSSYDRWAEEGCRLSAVVNRSHGSSDEIMLLARQKVTLQWTVENTGTCVWRDNYVVEFANTSLSVPNTVTVLSNSIRSTRFVTVAVQFIAPSQSGTFHLEGRLRGQENILFGQPLTYTLKVVSPQ